MTHSCESEEGLKALLRARGLRSTAPRLAVLRLLHDEQAPLSHAALLDRLPDGAFDRATVYRVLSDLADEEILRRMDLGDHVWRFELNDPCREIAVEHAHFLCKACDQVSCLPDSVLRGFQAAGRWAASFKQAQIRVSGTCPDCL